ncbi:hypothetical protein K435DRAFT_839029 [Dendrothele bispora CBS 962.96]|uniref:Uncharacterized protein n=1 Tax=Dendrothele bispora (strain CBS 962.96) TaxID=1314807 RepID=A0A4S8M3P0_DENBC|nr:hypothetical protein K435DRAFT_839029 [Dendrothele bispora CBS 962.96]
MFSKTLALLTTFSVVTSIYGNILPVLERRQISSQHGTLNAPTNGVEVSSGGDFPFQYLDSNWCHDGYTPISVWLTDYEPTRTDVNTTSGTFDEGKFTHFFGDFLVPNFGLPQLQGSTSPPSSLTLPDVSGSFVEGSELYLAVIETATDCPPGGVPPQYGLAVANMILG